MNKCPACGAPGLIRSGSHSFCSECKLIMFEISDDYMLCGCKLLSAAVSNSSYINDEVFEAAIKDLIMMHLPMIANSIHRVSSDTKPMMDRIMHEVKQHAINLVIGDKSALPQRSNTDNVTPLVRKRKQCLYCDAPAIMVHYDLENNTPEPVCEDCDRKLQYVDNIFKLTGRLINMDDVTLDHTED